MNKTFLYVVTAFGFIVIVAVLIFCLLYAMAAFSAWELDCRKWDFLGSYAVILLTVVLTFGVVAVIGREPKTPEKP
ncbi:hypothetical protein SDC9_17666 [bioreactor metagenome]|uniref:Uncharacterized protein n=1 Tax=bioreactor metagenome TaxID=1076179 RepID=A0A644TZK9_9ZZZZ|nr:hypothetical protein [Lentimicrobium sp.]MEA5111696.1 hypothetical protein [Lentimicrobium sp.]